MQVFKSQKKAYFLSYIVIRLLAVKTSWKSYSIDVNNAIPDIDGWKAHILRAAHQDTAKSAVIENLANNLSTYHYGLGYEISPNRLPGNTTRLV